MLFMLAVMTNDDDLRAEGVPTYAFRARCRKCFAPLAMQSTASLSEWSTTINRIAEQTNSLD